MLSSMMHSDLFKLELPTVWTSGSLETTLADILTRSISTELSNIAFKEVAVFSISRCRKLYSELFGDITLVISLMNIVVPSLETVYFCNLTAVLVCCLSKKRLLFEREKQTSDEYCQRTATVD